MNKETKLQFVQLFTEIATEMEIEETPEFDALNFMPIASSRPAHTEAVLALARDVASGCEAETEAKVLAAN